MSTKDDRRHDHKRVRAAERQVLHGGHSQTVHSYSWSPGSVLIPNDEDTRYPKKKNRSAPNKKHHCPERPGKRACEWIVDEREVPRERYDFNERRFYTDGTRTETYRLCGWCGAEQVKSRYGRRKWRAV